MDSSELHYISYDPEEVWNEMTETYIEEGGEPLYPGDEKEILLRSVQAIATSIMARVDNALRMATLTYARGEYLKEYGLKRNCVYIDAVAATAPVTMTFAAGGTARVIEAGTELTSDGSLLYALERDIEITGTEQIIETTIVCQTAGTIGNGLRAGSQMQFLEGQDGFVSCIVGAQASGGVDAEDEEVYRERIRNYGLSSVTTGPANVYEQKARAVSSQIVDARAIQDAPGDVGVYLIIAEDGDWGSLQPSVEQALNPDDVRPLTDRVTVKLAGSIPYVLNVKVYYSQYAGIGDAVTAAVEEYQTWQDQRIGRDWDPQRLMALLYQAGCDRVEWLSGSGLNGGSTVAYTEVDDNKRLSGTINLTVVNT